MTMKTTTTAAARFDRELTRLLAAQRPLTKLDLCGVACPSCGTRVLAGDMKASMCAPCHDQHVATLLGRR